MNNTNSLRGKKKSQQGFTLIELLISMTITLVIVGLLMGMTKMAVGAWRASSSKTKTSRQANDLLDTVGKDLEGMVVRSGNGYEWLLIEESDNADDELGPGGVKNMVNPLEISFFSAVTDRYYGEINTPSDLGGDISMVRYRLIHQDTIEQGGGTPVFALYRERVEPNVTFNTMLAQNSISGLKSSDDIVDVGNFLAENVFDFTISFNFEYTITAAGTTTTGYKRITVQAGGTNKYLSMKGDGVYLSNAGATLQNVLPAGASSPRLVGADISVLVLTDGGMRGLENKPVSSMADYLKENAYHYTRSVILSQP